SRIRKDAEQYLDNINKTGHGCFDENTQVLTEDGWKNWHDVSMKDKFATRTKSGILEYHRPKRLIRYNHEGRMYRVSGKGVDLLVTPDHRMLACITTTKKGRKRTDFSM